MIFAVFDVCNNAGSLLKVLLTLALPRGGCITAFGFPR